MASSASCQPSVSAAAKLLLLPKASEAAAMGLGGLGWGGEGGLAKAADEEGPGGAGMDALPLLLLDISPVAVSAYHISPRT